MTNYLLAGGGTAGHVNPLLAVADRIAGRGTADSMVVLGTAEGLEARLVPERGYDLEVVPRVPFPRRPDRRALAFPARFRDAVGRTRTLVREHGIDVLIGFGGYVAAPAYVAARREGIPYVVHEANSRPGLANVWGARRAAAVGTVFPDTRLPRARVVGMPLRIEVETLDRSALRVEAARTYGLDPHLPVLLVFGGSTGARRINTTMSSVWPTILESGWQVLHVTGHVGFEDLPDADQDGLSLVPYVGRMDLAYALADHVVCRAGASTVSEITALGIPATYVPYPVGNGEQALNAEHVVRAGGATMIMDAEFDPGTVRERLLPLLLDRSGRERMGRTAARFGVRDGTDRLIALTDEALRRRRAA